MSNGLKDRGKGQGHVAEAIFDARTRPIVVVKVLPWRAPTALNWNRIFWQVKSKRSGGLPRIVNFPQNF